MARTHVRSIQLLFTRKADTVKGLIPYIYIMERSTLTFTIHGYAFKVKVDLLIMEIGT